MCEFLIRRHTMSQFRTEQKRHFLALVLQFYFWTFDVIICLVLFLININSFKGFCQFVSILCNLFVWLLITWDCVNFCVDHQWLSSFQNAEHSIHKCSQIFGNMLMLIPIHITMCQLFFFFYYFELYSFKPWMCNFFFLPTLALLWTMMHSIKWETVPKVCEFWSLLLWLDSDLIKK